MFTCKKNLITWRKLKKRLFRQQTSAGELPVVTLSFVDVFKDFGFLSVFGFLVSKAASPATLLQLHTFTAVHIWGGAESRRTPDPRFIIKS